MVGTVGHLPWTLSYEFVDKQGQIVILQGSLNLSYYCGFPCPQCSTGLGRRGGEICLSNS